VPDQAKQIAMPQLERDAIESAYDDAVAALTGAFEQSADGAADQLGAKAGLHSVQRKIDDDVVQHYR
jgi:hypothetical protein